LKGRRALKLGYWLATEQHGPTRLLELATHAVAVEDSKGRADEETNALCRDVLKGEKGWSD